MPDQIQSNRLNQNTGTSTGIKALTSFGWHCFSKKYNMVDSLKNFLLRREKEFYKFFDIEIIQIADVKEEIGHIEGYG